MSLIKKTLLYPPSGYIAALFLFLFFYFLYAPITNVTFLYRDDYFRLFNQTLFWLNDGRYLSKLTFNLLTFSDGTYLSPLPQLLAIISMACITLWGAPFLIGKRNIYAFSLGALLFLNPFYMQNMSYGYDSLPMTLSSCAAIMAAAALQLPLRYLWLDVLCILFILYSYQPALGLYVSVTGFILLKHFLHHHFSFKRKTIHKAVLYLGLNGLILLGYKASFPVLFAAQNGRARFDYYHIAPNLHYLMEDIKLLFYPHFSFVFTGVSSLLLLSLFIKAIHLSPRPLKALLLWIWGCFILVFILSIIVINSAGPSLFLLPEPYSERLFIGASGLWLTALYVISTLSKRLYVGLYALFALLCFSFSYNYGAFLRFQEQHNAMLSTELRYDITHATQQQKPTPLFTLNPLPLAPVNIQLIQKTPLLARLYGEHHLLWLANATLYAARTTSDLATLPSMELICTYKQEIEEHPDVFKLRHSSDYVLYLYKGKYFVDFHTDSDVIDNCKNWLVLLSLGKKNKPVQNTIKENH